MVTGKEGNTMHFYPIDFKTWPRGRMFYYCVPWISFKHFAVHSYENKPYVFPSVEAGKIYDSEDGRKLLPLSITCHHAATDGYHVDRFLKELQREMDAFRIL